MSGHGIKTTNYVSSTVLSSFIPIRTRPFFHPSIFQFVEFTAAINCIRMMKLSVTANRNNGSRNRIQKNVTAPFTFSKRASAAVQCSESPHGVDAWQNSKLSTLIKLPKGLLRREHLFRFSKCYYARRTGYF